MPGDQLVVDWRDSRHRLDDRSSLDGGVVTDALFDEEGKSRSRADCITGRQDKQALEAARQGFARGRSSLDPRRLEATRREQGRAADAWAAAMRECQAEAAKDNALGRRCV